MTKRKTQFTFEEKTNNAIQGIEKMLKTLNTDIFRIFKRIEKIEEKSKRRKK